MEPEGLSRFSLMKISVVYSKKYSGRDALHQEKNADKLS